MKKHRIVVFGKSDCEKCKAMNHKIDELLKDGEYKDFEKQYVDVMSEDGLVMFCDLESLNPQRIPSFVIMKHVGDKFIPIENNSDITSDDICGKALIYQYYGLQTDYSNNEGKITSKMIEHVLNMVKKI